MSQKLWGTRPGDLYGRRQRDRLYTALWGIGVLFAGVTAASRWNPARITPVPRTRTAVITKRQTLAPDVVALTLADPDGGLLPAWTPGGHIDVVLPSGRRRQYSLCGEPGRRLDYRIAVRRIADGNGGSIEMHEAYREGDTLHFEGPRNAFHLGSGESAVLFVIGGIGVTPILPMIREAQARALNWRAVYVGRSREYMPLLDEVMAVDPQRVTVWADDERGRIATVAELLADADGDTAVYVCGPGGMLEAVRVARGEHADAPLHYERFSPPPIIDGVPFELELARSGRILQVPADRSALAVMLETDPTTPYSCQQGFCGTCRVGVLDGAVDRCGRTAEGEHDMLVCVSRSRGGRIVIDR
ncbi:oxidoreductase [Mycobacterium koreense]|uniref:Oxidoreductase n=1 Tax=Mycolicibacillus koreensis TaxID=1069220 RepID=A0A7I7SD95_9MYCO|nr:PDR/VanB family oxidoreductase [Mycolicibacillus koreensis]MCV7246803.1 oxidoreductase [Mycolicibacillus koreensis]ODR07594.1 oxidoreductase [Mycolicibacillus koreensis]OSC35406.1 oxidoreductase [Mycolicibacillus koreensis]BBY54331.1 oxidoreductase [Mycolicibacillus koreensis]